MLFSHYGRTHKDPQSNSQTWDDGMGWDDVHTFIKMTKVHAVLLAADEHHPLLLYVINYT